MDREAVILDTNVFVAAGFNPRSDSAQLIDLVRSGHLRMIWNDATRRETEYVVRKIPHLSWDSVMELFRPEDRFEGETHPEDFACVPDPEDRKFAALAAASGATLITRDEHLLQARPLIHARIMTPGEFRRHVLQPQLQPRP